MHAKARTNSELIKGRSAKQINGYSLSADRQAFVGYLIEKTIFDAKFIQSTLKK